LRGIKIGSYTSHIFCTILFGLCPYPDVPPITIKFPTAKPTTQRPGPSGKKPLQVVHVSDTHVDLSYTIGASYNCTKPICCRSYTDADAPGNNDFPAGTYGDTHCDAPLSLEQGMVAAIKKFAPDSSFTIFTGDVVAHDIWLTTEEEVTTDLDTTYSLFHSLNLVYPAVGNHDTQPTNSFPPKAIVGVTSEQFAFDTMAAQWQPWIGDAGAAKVQDDGSYSVKSPAGNLRVISFNSIYYYVMNFWMYEEPMEADPSGQLAWLVEELQAAETAGERVWMLSHVPPGAGDFFHSYSNYFDQIIQRYEATIAATFYGHTHTDEFQIAYSDYTKRTSDNAVMMSYIAPSLTPTSGPPSFRVYSVDPETFAILDFTQYITNISDPSFQNGPVWEKYYSAKEIYGPLVTPPLTDPAAELTAAFWHNVTDVFENDDAEFQAFTARRSRGFNVQACTGDCKTAELCTLRAARSQDNCGVITPGIHFGKRDEMTLEHRDECEGSRLKGLFAMLAQDKEAFVAIINGEVAKRS
jgi:sphingomyelin phosphodiesterase